MRFHRPVRKFGRRYPSSIRRMPVASYLPTLPPTRTTTGLSRRSSGRHLFREEWADELSATHRAMQHDRAAGGRGMNWLLSPRIRSFIALAAAASLLLNLAMIVPAIYMLQVFDRVFSSRSMETLVV